MLGAVKSLIEEMNYLKKELETTKSNYSEIKQENQLLKQIINTSFQSKSITVEQYGRRENLRYHGVPESTKNQSNGKEGLMAVTKELNVSIDKQVGIQ